MDLLPNGIWRYKNIHYFKWAYPFLGFYAWLTIRWIFGKYKSASPLVCTARLAATIGVITLILALHFSIRQSAAKNQVRILDNGRHTLTTDLASDCHKVDFIDISGLSGAFPDIYFGDHKVEIDRHDLTRVHDFRLLPTPFGARLLFSHPIAGTQATLQLGPNIALTPQDVTTRVGCYHFSLGQPKFGKDNVSN